jgi:hypothetical protein
MYVQAHGPRIAECVLIAAFAVDVLSAHHEARQEMQKQSGGGSRPNTKLEWFIDTQLFATHLSLLSYRNHR